MDADFKARLRDLVSPIASLSAEQLDFLERHYQLLIAWNQKLNLTRITDLDDAVRLHYAESLFLGTVLPRGSLRIADIGSGAGFPGIPIGVLRPECEVFLVESNKRKSVFLREACRGLNNIHVLAERAEEIADRYDWVVSRAVDPEAVLNLELAPRVALLTSVAGIGIPFSPGHFIQTFHVKQPLSPRAT